MCLGDLRRSIIQWGWKERWILLCLWSWSDKLKLLCRWYTYNTFILLIQWLFSLWNLQNKLVFRLYVSRTSILTSLIQWLFSLWTTNGYINFLNITFCWFVPNCLARCLLTGSHGNASPRLQLMPILDSWTCGMRNIYPALRVHLEWILSRHAHIYLCFSSKCY